MIKARENTISAWAFFVGIAIAVGIGVATTLVPIPWLIASSKYIYLLLVLIGIFVGIMHVASRESQTFMIAGAVLVIVSKFGMDSIRASLIGVGLGDAVSSIFGALLALFIPATIVVAIKMAFSLEKI